MKSKRWFTIALIGFLLSRLFILKFPPPSYSDVFHDYRRYAQMWNDGFTPYKKHAYEYPPATLPILYLPMIIRNLNLGHYYQTYRAQIFIFDLIIFIFILKALKKLKTKPLEKNIALAFYLIAPMLAKDFFYEGIDLAFTGALSVAIVSLFLFNQKQPLKRLFFWLFFWLSTSIKLMSAPLLAPFFYLKKLNLWQELKAFIASFVLIWGIPIVIFGTSLSVMFVFHARRGIKYASFPSFVVETINYWTQTETRLNQAPDFQLQGPISDIAEKVVAIVFPVSILLVLIYTFWLILKPNLKNLKLTFRRFLFLQPFSLNHLNPYVFSLKISLIYIYTIFLTGKIFSQPFHLWPLPLIALFPFKSLKKQLIFILLTLWLLIIDTTPWIRINEARIFLSPLPWKFVTYSSRFIPMFILLFQSFKLPDK